MVNREQGHGIEAAEEGVASGQSTQAASRRFGTLAGQFVVPDDFDAPLPEEELAAFEGHSDS